MVRRILLILALLMPSIASAQTFVKPPDVATYVEVVPTYSAGTTANNAIDASVSTPPGITNQLTGVAASTVTDQVTTGTYGDASGFKLTTADGGSGVEAKFRTHANCTKILPDDPIRNYGDPGGSHLHQFFGNFFTNAYSTYASQRGTTDSKTRRSFAGGGDLNATGYWFPAPILTNPFSDGKNYAVKCKQVVIYYKEDPAKAKKASFIPHGLRYVSGWDMDDSDRSWLQAHVDAANAQSGTANRYRLTHPTTGEMDAMPKWRCFTTGLGSSGSEDHTYLKSATNTDPWEGRCASGDTFYLAITAAKCWDGNNLWSPGGYKHVIPRVWDTQSSASEKWTCPNNYYEMPELILNIYFNQSGPSDYMEWRLSSDDMAATEAGRTILNGESAHFDWMDGWNPTTKETWLTNCIGAMGNTPHECNDGIISSTTELKRAGAVTVVGTSQIRSPQVDLTTNYPTTVASNMFEIPSSYTGPATVHVHGN